MGAECDRIAYVGLKCKDCFKAFDTVATCGPPGLCDYCTTRRREEILSGECGHHVLPVPGDRVTCGMRFDIPKNERGHDWVSLGLDTRHSDDGYFIDMEIFVCIECGRDKMKRPYVPRVIVDEAALVALIALARKTGKDVVNVVDALKIRKVR